MMSRTWRTCALFALALVAGAATMLAARPYAASTHAAHERFAAGHLENALRLAPDGRDEIALGNGSALRFHVKSQFEGPAVVRYATEITDELGNEIAAPETSEPLHMAAGAETSADIEIPADVQRGAGFYLFRITAAGRSGEDLADEVLEMGIAVVDGTAYPLDAEQWLELSLVNLGEAR